MVAEETEPESRNIFAARKGVDKLMAAHLSLTAEIMLSEEECDTWEISIFDLEAAAVTSDGELDVGVRLLEGLIVAGNDDANDLNVWEARHFTRCPDFRRFSKI